MGQSMESFGGKPAPAPDNSHMLVAWNEQPKPPSSPPSSTSASKSDANAGAAAGAAAGADASNKNNIGVTDNLHNSVTADPTASVRGSGNSRVNDTYNPSSTNSQIDNSRTNNASRASATGGGGGAGGAGGDSAASGGSASGGNVVSRYLNFIPPSSPGPSVIPGGTDSESFTLPLVGGGMSKTTPNLRALDMEQQRIQQDGSRLQNQTDLGNRSLSCQTMLDSYKLAQDSYDHAFNKFSQGGRGSTQVGNAQVFIAEKAATFAAMSAAGCVPPGGAPVEAPPPAMLKDETPPPVIEAQPLPRPIHAAVKHQAPPTKTDCPPK